MTNIDLVEKCCKIVEYTTKNDKSKCDFIFYKAFDIPDNKFLGSALTLNELVNDMHMKYGYHKFEVVDERL